MNTNSIIMLQQLSAHAGYQLSSAEISGLVALGGGFVHVCHQAVSAWGNAGGWQGVKSYFNNGKISPTVNNNDKTKTQ